MAQAIARKKNNQGSPVKMRIVLNEIRGKKVPEALSILHFLTNRASHTAEQTLRSAVANFQLKDENRNINVEELFVVECFADGGQILKRILPAPMGRAFRVRKRSNHLTIVVSDKERLTKKTTAARKAAEAKKEMYANRTANKPAKAAKAEKAVTA